MGEQKIMDPGGLMQMKQNVIYRNVKDVRKYIHTPGEAVDNEYTWCAVSDRAGTKGPSYGNELPSGFFSF